MKQARKIVEWTVFGVLLISSAGFGPATATASMRDGLLPGSAQPQQPETQLPTGVHAAPAPTDWAAPGDSQLTALAPATEVAEVQQMPADSAAAEQEMLTRLKKPDGRTRQGLGWFIGGTGLLGLFGSGSAFGLALFYLLLGALLLWSGRDKYRKLRAERQKAEAAGAKPFTEVRGRVGRGVLLFPLIVMGIGVVVVVVVGLLGSGISIDAQGIGQIAAGNILVYALLVGLILGAILLAWRKSAYAKALLANGFPKRRK